MALRPSYAPIVENFLGRATLGKYFHIAVWNENMTSSLS